MMRIAQDSQSRFSGLDLFVIFFHGRDARATCSVALLAIIYAVNKYTTGDEAVVVVHGLIETSPGTTPKAWLF